MKVKIFLVCATFSVSLVAFTGCGSDHKRQPIAFHLAWQSTTTKSGGDGVVRLLDFDFDGDLDLATSKPDPRRWVIYENTGKGPTDKIAWESKANSDCDQIEVIDFNQDSWPDLAGTHETNCTLFLNKAGDYGTHPDWKTNFTADANQIDFGDYDNDNDIDMLMAAGKPIMGVVILDNTNGTISQIITKKLGPREYCETAIFTDYDGDGDVDIVAAYADGRILAFPNKKGNFSNTHILYQDKKYPWTQQIYVTDLNSDGNMEIVCAKGFWPEPAPSVILKLTGPFTTEVTWKSDPLSDYHGFAFGDINGDGKVDLVAADWGKGGQQGVHIFLGRSGIFDEKPDLYIRTNSSAHEVAVGDIDGDGDLDLAVGCKDKALIYENVTADKSR